MYYYNYYNLQNFPQGYLYHGNRAGQEACMQVGTQVMKHLLASGIFL